MALERAGGGWSPTLRVEWQSGIGTLPSNSPGRDGAAKGDPEHLEGGTRGPCTSPGGQLRKWLPRDALLGRVAHFHNKSHPALRWGCCF